MSRYRAKGTLLKIGDGAATEQYTTIAQVITIGGPSLSQETIDATDHDSGDYRDFLLGFADGGEVTLEIHYDPAGSTHDASTGILSRFGASVPTNFKLVFPDPAQTTWSFAAYLTAFEPQAPADGKLTANITLKVSGDPTLA